MDTKPEIIGTLTSDENATLDTLLKTGLEKKVKTKPSASAASSRDLEQVKTELTESSSPVQTSLPQPRVEPLLCVHRLTQQDIININNNLKREQTKTLEKTRNQSR